MNAMIVGRAIAGFGVHISAVVLRPPSAELGQWLMPNAGSWNVCRLLDTSVADYLGSREAKLHGIHWIQ